MGLPPSLAFLVFVVQVFCCSNICSQSTGEDAQAGYIAILSFI